MACAEAAQERIAVATFAPLGKVLLPTQIARLDHAVGEPPHSTAIIKNISDQKRRKRNDNRQHHQTNKLPHRIHRHHLTYVHWPSDDRCE